MVKTSAGIVVFPMKRVYFDTAATAVPHREIWDESYRVSEHAFGNPSSAHSEGRRARDLLEEARQRCADALDVEPNRLIFTSGGTESNNSVISSFILNKRPAGVVASGFEHASAAIPIQRLSQYGFDLTMLEAGNDGRLEPGTIEGKLPDDTSFASIMHVNNETGVIQDMTTLTEALRNASGARRSIHIHSDCVQSLGKIPLFLGSMGIDSASFSGHKLGAPRGAGLLYLNRRIEPLIVGGGQEKGMRSGTENLAAVWGMMRAVETRLDSLDNRIESVVKIKRRLIDQLETIQGGIIIHGNHAYDPNLTSPYIIMVSFPPVPAEVLTRVLDDRGYLVSPGSACSSQKRDPRVLRAMGYSEDIATSSVRISLDTHITERDIDGLCDTIREEIPLLTRAAS